MSDGGIASNEPSGKPWTRRMQASETVRDMLDICGIGNILNLDSAHGGRDSEVARLGSACVVGPATDLAGRVALYAKSMCDEQDVTDARVKLTKALVEYGQFKPTDEKMAATLVDNFETLVKDELGLGGLGAG